GAHHQRIELRRYRPADEIEVESDEQRELVVVAALNDRHPVELTAGEGGRQGLRQDLAIDIGRDARAGLGQELRYAERAQAIGGAAAEAGADGAALRLRRRQARQVERIGAALDDGALEQSGGARRGDVGQRAQAARRFAEQRHAMVVAAKAVDVPPYPLERELL